jgi:Tol biopolymer transport system component
LPAPVLGAAFSPDGTAIAMVHQGPLGARTISVYSWSGSGFGTLYSDPATMPAGQGYGVTFSPDGSTIAVAHDSSPYVSAYPWSASGFGVKYADPATLPTGSSRGIDFSP